jgi:hypothetical protein
MKYYIVLLTTVFSVGLHAQITGWKQLPGLNTGQVVQVEAAKNSDIFAVTYEHLYRRDADTKNWILCKTPFFSSSSQSYGTVTTDIGGAHYLCLSPSTTATPPTLSHGLYRSSDNGSTWQQVIFSKIISFISISPSGKVYAISNDRLAGSSSIFESKDNGISWDSISSFPFIAVDFMITKDEKCFFSLYNTERSVLQYDIGSGLYKSLTVNNHSSNITQYSFLASVNGIPLVRFDSAIYVIKSDNTLELKGKLDPSPMTIHGLIVSGDGTLYTVTYNPFSTDQTNYQILYSTDYGATWNNFLSKPTNTYFYGISIALDPTGNFYFGSYYSPSLYMTSDKGSSWQEAGISKSSNVILQAGPEETLFCRDNSVNQFISFDEGLNWQAPDSLPTGSYGLFGERQNASFFYFDQSEFTSGTRIWYADSHAPFSFTQQALLDITIPIATGEYNNRFYLSAPTFYQPELLLVSTDLGVNWEQIDAPGTGTVVHSFNIDAKGTLYLGYAPSLYRSSDEGRTWNNVHTPLKNTSITTIKFAEPKMIILGTSGDGVWHSTDDGINWTRWNPSGPDSINTLEIYGGKCYAGSQQGLISCSLTSNNWQHELLADEELPILQLLNYQDKRLYASVGNLGIWTNDLTLRSVNRSKASTKLLTVFTDPFSGSTTILLDLTNPEHVVLDLYDILGRKVMGLANSDFVSGEYHIPLKGVLPSGMYTILLRTQRYAETEKIVVAH